jgi:hypothetical protein
MAELRRSAVLDFVYGMRAGTVVCPSGAQPPCNGIANAKALHPSTIAKTSPAVMRKLASVARSLETPASVCAARAGG